MAKQSNTVPIIAGITIAAILYNAYKIKRPPTFFIVQKLPRGHNAMTVPPFGIWITQDGTRNRALLEHELIHWQQYQQRGLFGFYFDYFRELRKHGYDNMPMEVEARIHEPEHVKRDYTNAVREGRAVTVYNPEFRK